MSDQTYEVIVVGGGNAALCAALSAQEQGVKVLVLERAPEEQRGGNSAYTGGGFRMVHNGVATVKTVVPDLSEGEIANTDFGEYTAEEYLDDLGRVTQWYCDPDLAEAVVLGSTETVQWLHSKGVRFVPRFGRYAFKHEGKFKFFGGTVVEAAGGGRGLVQAEYAAAEKRGITVRYNAQAIALLRGRGGVQGVRIVADGVEEEIRAKAVVLASGGFEANREWRAGLAGYATTTWYGLLGPAGMRPAVVERLSTAANKTVMAPELRDRMLADGAEPIGSTPAAFQKHLATEIAKWRKVVKSAGVTAE